MNAGRFVKVLGAGALINIHATYDGFDNIDLIYVQK